VYDQRVIAYDKRGQKGCVYATAYTDTQAEAALRRCVAEHGRRTNARVVLAKDHWQKYQR
jgi:hypothetical protein